MNKREIIASIIESVITLEKKGFIQEADRLTAIAEDLSFDELNPGISAEEAGYLGADKFDEEREHNDEQMKNEIRDIIFNGNRNDPQLDRYPPDLVQEVQDMVDIQKLALSLSETDTFLY